MNAEHWAVIVAGLAAIGWVNWYFLFAGRRGAAVATGDVGIVVDGGYSPSTIRVKAGRPVRLVFDRRDTSSCSEEVVFPDFGIRKFLPAFQKTVVELNPAQAGTYEFTCGMSMLRGRLVVEG